MIRFWHQKNHYIYMIYCEETGLTKIGITDNPKRRIREISSDCAFDVELLATWIVSKELSRGFEAMLHEAFSYCRHHGEWFKIDAPERRELSGMKRLGFSAWQKNMVELTPTMPSNSFHTGLMR